MTVDDFSLFYQEVHGYPPFDWQEQLLRRVVAQGWPGTIALPTSSGKTSAIDIAIFHLALEAELAPQARRAPLRTFFVIDRRVVVDEAAEHGTKLAKALRKSESKTVARVADRLRRFGGVPLKVSAMRGGMYRDSSWADEPNQPLICVSTVDQTGSRVLFRGYQVGESSRPVHAGLIANDSLIIVDEAHLSRAFVDTLSTIRDRYIKWADKPPTRAFQLVEMSATPHSGDTFGIDAAGIAKNPVLARRLNVSKPSELRVPKKKFEDEMIAAAKDLASAPGVRIVGIIANTVGSARAIFTELSKAKNADAVLLVGRNRPFCAKRLWDEYKARIEASMGREPGELLFVVATQTVEVGANIDFDALVTESAPLNALRQRFGRLNRLGRSTVSKAAIVLRPKEDVVYGEATQRTWDFLKQSTQVDFGVSATEALLQGVDLTPLNAKSSRGPLLFPAHIEFWVQTNPAPSPNPDVAPFLHGDQALEAADVQIVWRKDLGEEPEEWGVTVELAPPVSTEALSLPIATVRRWLKDQEQEVVDVEGIVPEAKEESKARGRLVLQWRGVGKNKVVYASGIRPGDTIVVPSTYGGADRYGWNPSGNETEDIGDLANNLQAKEGVRRPRLRLSCLDADTRAKLEKPIARLLGSEDQEPDPTAEAEINAVLSTPFRGRLRIDQKKNVITWPKQERPRDAIEPESEETDEDDGSSFAEGKVPIDVHTEGVEARARRYAEICGLTPALADDLAMAARFHDLGKFDERFQSWLYGRPFGGNDQYLAKSGGDRTYAERRRLREAAGYPANARHEAGSVMAASAVGLSDAHDEDLVLHLIGTHHGFGRPLMPLWQEDEAYSFEFTSGGVTAECTTGRELANIQSGWVDRFWTLNNRYGYWGLAYLESILRRADCMQSRWEEEQCRN